MSRRTLPLQIASILVLLTLAFSIVAPTQVHAGVFGNIQDDIKKKLEKGFEDGSISCVAAAAVAALFSYLASALTNVPTTDVPDVLKEQIMDCVFWAIKNSIIKEITKDTVGYVQTGMNGNPAFAQNVQQYLLSVADKTAGEYIQQTTAGDFLCSPFRSEIQQALTRYYQEQSGRGPSGAAGGGTSCSLTGVVSNLDDFLDGNFSAGGWDAWITMYEDPYNNSFGAYMESKNELDRRVEAAKEEAKQKLQQGNGFYGKETQNCYTTEYITEDGTKVNFQECDTPETETPGTSVKNAFEQTLGITMDELANADELSELITLWMTNMLHDMLIGEKGIAGYDPNDFEHTVPETTISDENWDDIDIGPQPGGQCTSMDISDGVPGQPNGRLVNEPEPFTSTASDPFKEIDISVPPGQNYSRVKAEFDLTTAPITAPDNASQLNLFWFHRGPNMAQAEWGANDIAEVVLNVEGRDRVRFATSVNSCEMLEHGAPSPFDDNVTYQIVVDYNPGSGTMTVSANGSVIVSQPTTVNVLQSGDQHGRGGFFIKLGNAENMGADEGLADGFTWSNLRVTFTPGTATTGGGGGGGGGGDDDDDDTCVPFGTTTCEGPAPTVTLTATSPVNSGSPTTLTWSSTDATSCTAMSGSGFVTGGATSGSDTSDNLTTTTTFSVRCRGAGGAQTASAVVTVNTAPTLSATLTATPGSIAAGEHTTLTWSSTNATSCVVTTGADSGFEIVGSAPSGSDVTGNLTTPTTFGISCTGAGGVVVASTVVNIRGIPPGGSCTDCTPLTDPPFTITAPCGSQCSADTYLTARLQSLDTLLNNTGDPILTAWRITEAYPLLVSHPNPCYQSGTCVGANIADTSINSTTAGYLTSFAIKVWAASAHVCYEVPSQSVKDAWITAGLTAIPIQVVSGITASRFNIHTASANWLECTN